MSSASVKSTLFATDGVGGLCGNNDGLKREKNLRANFEISLGTKATDCFLVLSTSAAASDLFGGCRLGEDVIVLAVGRILPL